MAIQLTPQPLNPSASPQPRKPSSVMCNNRQQVSQTPMNVSNNHTQKQPQLPLVYRIAPSHPTSAAPLKPGALSHPRNYPPPGNNRPSENPTKSLAYEPNQPISSPHHTAVRARAHAIGATGVPPGALPLASLPIRAQSIGRRLESSDALLDLAMLGRFPLSIILRASARARTHAPCARD